MIMVPFLVMALNYCEKHLIAEDPYQFEHLSVDQLIYVYWLNKNQDFRSEALINEMKKRLVRDLNDEEKELLRKTLANERDG